MFAPIETGGSDVTAYELYMDQGSINSVFSKVESYGLQGGNNASLLRYSVEEATDGLVVGRIYSFKMRSANLVGFSEFSELVRVGLANRVLAP
jgi:hypothetical protein